MWNNYKRNFNMSSYRQTIFLLSIFCKIRISNKLILYYNDEIITMKIRTNMKSTSLQLNHTYSLWHLNASRVSDLGFLSEVFPKRVNLTLSVAYNPVNAKWWTIFTKTIYYQHKYVFQLWYLIKVWWKSRYFNIQVKVSKLSCVWLQLTNHDNC